MKKKMIIAIVLIMIGIFIFLGVKVFKTASEGILIEDEFLVGDMIEPDDEDVVFITGQITSFNTEMLDTGLWTKIDKVLPQNETMVTNGQEILNVSNEAATGKIYATIDGEFIENTEGLQSSYVIYDLNNLGFEAEVEEEKASFLKIGQKVDVTIQASNEKVERKNLLYILYTSKCKN